MKPLVYLAGPIAGLDYADATDWRFLAKYALGQRGIEALSPMRAKEALGARNDGRISNDHREYADIGPFFTSRGIMARDFNDVKRSDVLLVNLLGTKARTVGTVMELGWAFALQKPTVVAMEPGNVHEGHPMIAETIDFRVETLDEAFDTVAVLLNR